MTTSHPDPLALQLPRENLPENGSLDTVPFISKSDAHMFSEVTKDSIADENVNDKCTAVKANKGTMTDNEDGDLLKCRYCLRRMSVLRKIEKVKSIQRSLFFGAFEKYSSQQIDHSRRNHGCQTPACLYEGAEMTYQEMRRLAIVLGLRNEKSLQTDTFCKCVANGWDRDCRCGEEDKYVEWVWDTVQRGDATSLKEQGSLVVFHEDYSSGTTAIRGLKAMDMDQHFWEIKMTTPVYGTDMMIGVGTKNVELNKYHNTFCSMLGSDLDSWGISYDGRVQHGGRKRKYCSRFGQGTIIGVHLDMWHGTLTFFKNRHSLGIAFGGLRGRTLYPMVCSTAARSGMRVISARSFPSSLQFLCCQILRQFIPSHLSVLDTLSMPPGLRSFLANNISWLLDIPHKRPSKPSSVNICHICLPLTNTLEGHTDEEDSSDEEKLDNIISFRDSDNDSEEEEPGDFSDSALQRHTVTRYLMRATLRSRSAAGSSSPSSSNLPEETETSFSSGSGSDTASPSLSSSSAPIVGASTPVLPGSSRLHRQLAATSDNSAAKKAKLCTSLTLHSDTTCEHQTEESNGRTHQTQISDLTEESTDINQKCLLGKRKHT
ncbi:hypothetical protein BsWGS_06857 [Bradybaena similaris]